MNSIPPAGLRLLRRRGFTILELMMVVMIISILFSVAALKFNNTLRKTKEGATMGNLGAVRTALNAYYADQTSSYPSSLSILTVGGQYLSAFPSTVLLGYHQDSSSIREGNAVSALDDSGGWSYDNDPEDSRFGTVWVNCTHTDTKGTLWTSY